MQWQISIVFNFSIFVLSRAPLGTQRQLTVSLRVPSGHHVEVEAHRPPRKSDERSWQSPVFSHQIDLEFSAEASQLLEFSAEPTPWISAEASHPKVI